MGFEIAFRFERLIFTKVKRVAPKTHTQKYGGGGGRGKYMKTKLFFTTFDRLLVVMESFPESTSSNVVTTASSNKVATSYKTKGSDSMHKLMNKYCCILLH